MNVSVRIPLLAIPSLTTHFPVIFVSAFTLTPTPHRCGLVYI
jgi:hypothetical protein